MQNDPIFSKNGVLIGALLSVFILACLCISSANWAYFQKDLHEIADFAANSLLVHDAKKWQLLVGNYSRIGFNHPGPALLYALALGEFIFFDLTHWVASPFSGQLVMVTVLAAFWLTCLLGLLWKLTHSLRASAVLLSLFAALSSQFDFQVFVGMWFPHLYFLPFATFLLSLAGLRARQWNVLPVLVVSGGTLVHGHAAFIALVGLLLTMLLFEVFLTLSYAHLASCGGRFDRPMKKNLIL